MEPFSVEGCVKAQSHRRRLGAVNRFMRSAVTDLSATMATLLQNEQKCQQSLPPHEYCVTVRKHKPH
ncbi:hypothetical protein NQZ68_024342 [Dissostichus eleginoides]|nr:hypothetical protein NQZ68_024342 [Dissostichus eleginoides]